MREHVLVLRVRGRTSGAWRVGRPLRRYVPPLILLGLFIAAWQGIVVALSVPSYILPTPSEVYVALVARGWAYLPDIWTTFQEIVAGYLLGLMVGVLVAALIMLSRTLRDALYPLLISSQMIPIFALAAVLTIVFSYGLLPQIIVTALYSFFPIVVNTADGLAGVDPELVNLLRTMGASPQRILRTVRLPAALPSLFSGSKLAVTFAVSGAVIGEWIGGESGLGYLMRFQNGSLDVAGMFATTVVLSLLGVALFAVVAMLEYVALPWHRAEPGDLGNFWRSR